MRSQFAPHMEESDTMVSTAHTERDQEQPTTPLYPTSSPRESRYSSHRCLPPAHYSPSHKDRRQNIESRSPCSRTKTASANSRPPCVPMEMPFSPASCRRCEHQARMAATYDSPRRNAGFFRAPISHTALLSMGQGCGINLIFRVPRCAWRKGTGRCGRPLFTRRLC